MAGLSPFRYGISFPTPSLGSGCGCLYIAPANNGNIVVPVGVFLSSRGHGGCAGGQSQLESFPNPFKKLALAWLLPCTGHAESLRDMSSFWQDLRFALRQIVSHLALRPRRS